MTTEPTPYCSDDITAWLRGQPLEINIHPWIDGLWVVTVNGQCVCDPVPLEEAKRLAKLWTPVTFRIKL